MIVDQAIFPSYIVTSYLFWANYLTYGNLKRARQNVKNKIKNVLMVNYTFWPLINLFNFRYVPLLYRTIYINFFATFWNGYLAFKNAEVVKRNIGFDMMDK